MRVQMCLQLRERAISPLFPLPNPSRSREVNHETNQVDGTSRRSCDHRGRHVHLSSRCAGKKHFATNPTHFYFKCVGKGRGSSACRDSTTCYLQWERERCFIPPWRSP